MNEKNFIARYWKTMFFEADKRGASDIHIEPNEPDDGKLSVRFGIMDDLVIYDTIDDSVNIPSYLTKLEQICGCDVTEKNIAQDKSFYLPGTRSRYRVSFGPATSFDPESIVFRVINQGKIPALETCCLPDHFSQDLYHFLRKKQGIFITTGPTGSGKTTTCHAGLMHIDRKKKKVISLEDPIERSLPWVRQYEITTKFNWEDGIRTLMRQKPHVIFVGEIRDRESAKRAMEAANTGHLVITTMHTNSVSHTFKRLTEDFDFNLSNLEAITLCAAQRLIQILCPDCKVRDEVSGKFMQGNGCGSCRDKNPGLSGLQPIFEHIFKPSEEDIKSYENTGKMPVVSTLKDELAKLIDKGQVDYRSADIYG